MMIEAEETIPVSEKIDDVVTEAIDEIVEETIEAKDEVIEAVVEDAAEKVEAAHEAAEAIAQAAIMTTLGTKIETIENESAQKWQDLENLKLQVATLTGELAAAMTLLSQSTPSNPSPMVETTSISSPDALEDQTPAPEPPLEKPAPRRRWI